MSFASIVIESGEESMDEKPLPCSDRSDYDISLEHFELPL